MKHDIVWQGDTEYGQYQIIDTIYDNRPARVLYSGDQQAAQSGVATDEQPDMLFDYNQRMLELATNIVPKSILLIGGGVCTLPKAVLEALPDVHIDVVELDQKLTQLAYEYFDLPVDDRLQLYHTDGRTFLAQSTKRYEMIFLDAFTHTTIPRELKTLEAFQSYFMHLTDHAVFAANVISGYHGPTNKNIRQMSAAAQNTFGTVDIFLASRGFSKWLPQNFVLAAQKGTNLPLQDYVRNETVEPLTAGPGDLLYD